MVGATAATVVVVAGIVIGALALVGRWDLTTNVTISLHYTGDDGRAYSCVYDYRTPNRLPMPPAIAEEMNARDWSQTGPRMYEWAKNHPAASWTTQDEFPADDPRSTRADATWGAAMEKFVRFPPWQVETDHGSEYALWSNARPGSNCEDGLR